MTVMRSIPSFLLRALDLVMEFFCVVFGLAIGAVVVLICADIFMRNLRIGSLPWMVEVTEYALYAGTFLAAPWVLRQGSHVRVDLLLISLPIKIARRIEQFADLCGLIACVVMSYYGVIVLADAYQSRMVQLKSLSVPEWLLLLPIPLGCGLLAIEFVLRILRVPGIVTEQYNPANRASI